METKDYLQRNENESLKDFYFRAKKALEPAYNLVVGDKIIYKEPVFEVEESRIRGRKPKYKYVGERYLIGTIEKDSYGKKKGLHTFFIRVEDELDPYGLSLFKNGALIRRLGHNVYKTAIILKDAENKEIKTIEKNNRAYLALKNKIWHQTKNVEL